MTSSVRPPISPISIFLICGFSPLCVLQIDEKGKGRCLSPRMCSCVCGVCLSDGTMGGPIPFQSLPGLHRGNKSLIELSRHTHTHTLWLELLGGLSGLHVRSLSGRTSLLSGPVCLCQQPLHEHTLFYFIFSFASFTSDHTLHHCILILYRLFLQSPPNS